MLGHFVLFNLFFLCDFDFQFFLPLKKRKNVIYDFFTRGQKIMWMCHFLCSTENETWKLRIQSFWKSRIFKILLKNLDTSITIVSSHAFQGACFTWETAQGFWAGKPSGIVFWEKHLPENLLHNLPTYTTFLNSRLNKYCYLLQTDCIWCTVDNVYQETLTTVSCTTSSPQVLAVYNIDIYYNTDICCVQTNHTLE